VLILPRLLYLYFLFLLFVDHSTPSSLPPHLNSSHSFLQSIQPTTSSSFAAFGRYLYILWVRFDETIMKPLFGGSSADSSRLFLLRSTRSLTAYSILSEQSKREEVDEILMKSGELNEILETSAEHEEEEVFGRSDRDQTAFEMPERFQSSLGRWVTSLLASLLFDRCVALGVPHLHCLCPQFLPTRLHHVDHNI
jgi:hypothetical protein